MTALETDWQVKERDVIDAILKEFGVALQTNDHSLMILIGNEKRILDPRLRTIVAYFAGEINWVSCEPE